MKEPEIIFEDSDIVVLNKPSGMIVYPDGKHDYPALDAWLKERYEELHFVHRLDRETSGVMVLARSERAHAFLKRQFADREVRKTYRAFVHGPLKDERGVIDKPIGSARGGMGPRSAVKPHGLLREAITTYRVIGHSPEASYVEVFPKTGRTHQIRVHFASVQHPVVCDALYAPSRPKILGFERLALHAYMLALRHPNGEEMSFTAPLPQEFDDAERELKKSAE